MAEAIGLGSGPAAAAGTVGSSSSSNANMLAVSVSRQALRTLLVLVQVVKGDCSPAVSFYQQQKEQTTASSSSSSSMLQCYSLCGLQPCELLRLLCDCLIGVTEGVDYTCRALATAAACELLQAQQAVTRAQLPPAGHGSAAAAAAASQSAGGVGAAGAVLHLLEGLICKVLMPAAGRQLPGFSGKALVRLALQGLEAVVEGPLVCDEAWTEAWAAIGGTFWLSR